MPQANRSSVVTLYAGVRPSCSLAALLLVGKKGLYLWPSCHFVATSAGLSQSITPLKFLAALLVSCIAAEAVSAIALALSVFLPPSMRIRSSMKYFV